MEVARKPAYLGAEVGFFSVRYTWNQKSNFIPMSTVVLRKKVLGRNSWPKPKIERNTSSTHQLDDSP
jgi:hypothetical protein